MELAPEKSINYAKQNEKKIFLLSRLDFVTFSKTLPIDVNEDIIVI